MCRALKVLCAAPDRERLAALKRGAVSVSWELVGGATSTEQLVEQARKWGPHVVVIDAGLGERAVAAARSAAATARIVALGRQTGADAECDDLEGLRAAILGLPRPGGPVTR